MIRAGYLQFEPRLGEAEANRARLRELLAGTPAELVVLPELATSGYCLETEQLAACAEEADGPTTALLAELAAVTGAHYVCGLPERAGGRYYNSAVLVGPRGLIGCYRKLHLFGFERDLFTPGDAPAPVFDLGAFRVGLMICFDWIFPEVARSLALAEAQLIAHPADLVLPWCPRAMPLRALENRVFTITADRVGMELHRGEPVRFIGESLIVSPAGEVLHRADGTEEELGLAELDPVLSDNKRLPSGNDLFAERRPELYRL